MSLLISSINPSMDSIYYFIYKKRKASTMIFTLRVANEMITEVGSKEDYQLLRYKS